MDGETLAAIGFMIFCFGFFLLVIMIILRQDSVDKMWYIREAREFGFRKKKPEDGENPAPESPTTT